MGAGYVMCKLKYVKCAHSHKARNKSRNVNLVCMCGHWEVKLPQNFIIYYLAIGRTGTQMKPLILTASTLFHKGGTEHLSGLGKDSKN